MILKWKRGGKWWLGTECGGYTVAKAMCGGLARYSAYHGKDLISVHDDVDSAKAACEAYSQGANGE